MNTKCDRIKCMPPCSATMHSRCNSLTGVYLLMCGQRFPVFLDSRLAQNLIHVARIFLVQRLSQRLFWICLVDLKPGTKQRLNWAWFNQALNVPQASSHRRCEIGDNTLTSITIVSLSKITKATPQQEKASYLSVFLKKYSASSFCLRTVSITFSMLVLQANQAMQKTKCTALEQSHSSSIHFMRVTYLWARSSRICMRATYLWARSSRICMRNLPRPLRRTSFTSWTS